MGKNKELGKVLGRYRVVNGKHFRLDDIDPEDTGPFKADDKDAAEALLSEGTKALAELQEKLYAQDRWSLLVIFQAMDAAGKDGTIKHVMSGVNPQGCQVTSFKVPSAEEIDHDFLWRTNKALPERGRIGIFNRSYYEEVLIVRVHQNLLAGQRIPEQLVTKRIWKERFEAINAMERHLARNGTAILKFFLHVSKKEQKRRFLERIDDPTKNWKFSLGDLKEREYWDDYMGAYEDAIRHTASEHAPWYVVPADHKWFARLVVSQAIVNTLEGLKLAFPKLDDVQRKALEQARTQLR